MRRILVVRAPMALLIILSACAQDPLGPATPGSGTLAASSEDGDSMSTGVLGSTDTVPEYVDASEIELYKDFNISGARDESVLAELGFVKGVDFGVRPTSHLATLGIPSDTRVIIISSNGAGGGMSQGNVNSTTSQANLAAFVEGGGVLVMHLADGFTTGSYLTPGLIGFASDGPLTNLIELADPGHGLAIGPDGVLGTGDDWTQTNIQVTLGCCGVQGYLPPLPADARVIIRSSGNPVMAEYRLGNGRVIVTTIPTEFGTNGNPGVVFGTGLPRSVLRNEFYYATHLDTRPPLLMDLIAQPNPVSVNDGVTLTALVDDSDTGDSDLAGAEYSLDGGPFDTMEAQDGDFDSSVEGVEVLIPPFSETGVHEVCVRATDVAENTSTTECMLVAVYDPSAGFVTGAGWIASPLGAYVADPTLIGKARFAFIAKYQKGANLPSGNSQFVFLAGDVDFRSSSYDWLVVSGARAQFKGIGTINGMGDYGFLLSAIDGQLNGGGGIDKFRIKIWDRTSGDAIVYDNKPGGSDTGSDATELGGGVITIHAN